MKTSQRRTLKKLLRKHKRKIVSVGSAAGSAGVLYFIWGTWFAAATVLVIVVHEFGHWVVARHYGADTGYVIFIPLGLFIVAATQVMNLADEFKAKVAMAGPIFGTIMALILGLCILILALEHLFFPALMLLIFEVLGFFVGSDAKKYRHARRYAAQ